MEFVYHITSKSIWESQQAKGTFLTPTFNQDGFIHFSTLPQVRKTAHKFYQGQKDLVILEVDPTFYPGKLIFENLDGGSELFPHLYAPLSIRSVHQVFNLPLNPEAEFDFPALFLSV